MQVKLNLKLIYLVQSDIIHKLIIYGNGSILR
jgi:hypothetical protein